MPCISKCNIESGNIHATGYIDLIEKWNEIACIVVISRNWPLTRLLPLSVYPLDQP